MIDNNFKANTEESIKVILAIFGGLLSVFLFMLLVTGLFKLYLLWLDYINLTP